MKLALIGTGNMPLMQWILDGKGDDAIINMSALARKLGVVAPAFLTAFRPTGSILLLSITSTYSDNEN